MPYQPFAPAQIQGFADALTEEASHDQLTELYGVVLGEDRSPQRSRSKRLRSYMRAAQAR